MQRATLGTQAESAPEKLLPSSFFREHHARQGEQPLSSELVAATSRRLVKS